MNLRIAPALAFALAASPSFAATTVIKVFSFDFGANPPVHSDPVIELGDTVSWVWAGGIHTTTSAAGMTESWNSGFKSSGNFDHTFTHLGSFAYYCSLHGGDLGGGSVSGMSGKVIVANGFVPGTATVVRGKTVSGTVAQVTTSNDQYLTVQMGPIPTPEASPLVVRFTTVSSVLSPTTLAVNVEDKSPSTGITRKVELLNVQTNNFETVGTGPTTAADTVAQVLATGTLARFVNQSNGTVTVRVSYTESSTSVPPKFRVSIDRVAVLAR